VCHWWDTKTLGKVARLAPHHSAALRRRYLAVLIDKRKGIAWHHAATARTDTVRFVSFSQRITPTLADRQHGLSCLPLFFVFVSSGIAARLCITVERLEASEHVIYPVLCQPTRAEALDGGTFCHVHVIVCRRSQERMINSNFLLQL